MKNLIKVALYQPDIPQNTAAIIRLCACFKTRLDIIGPCGFNIADKRLKRVSMDYKDNCEIKLFRNYEEFIINRKNERIILMTTKAKKKYHIFKFKKNDILLFGRESAGVPNELHKNIKDKLVIPIQKNTRSLNVVTSVSIVLSEALKQNNIL